MAKPIPFDDVPENLHQLYDIVGGELLAEIVEVYGGELVHIPKRSTIERKRIHEDIRKEYNGNNTSHLAWKYGYSERHIRTIVSSKKEEG